MEFFRQPELETIVSFFMTLQRKIIPGEKDSFQGFYPIWAICQIFKAILNIEWLFFVIAQCN